MMPGASDDDPGRPGRPGTLPRGRAGRERDLPRLQHGVPTRSSRPTSCATPTSWRGCATCSTSSSSHLQSVIARLANRLQRRLLAKQTRAWEFDLEEGILDAARLSRVVTNPVLPLVLQARAGDRVPRHGRDAC